MINYIKNIVKSFFINRGRIKINFGYYYNNGHVFIPFEIKIEDRIYKASRPISIEVDNKEDAELIIRMISLCANKRISYIRSMHNEC